jgi:probable F420-dependent oxidoreductase
MTRLRFGLGVPTATEGMMYPVPYADVHEAVHLACEAERLGFDSVWGNDHVSTQQYVRSEYAEPPRFFDPLTYLAFVAARTARIRLATGVLVMGFRNPVTVAKAVATVDHLSDGRFVLGLGIGAYREEYEAMWPDRRVDRGMHAAEYIEALRLLFTERRASFDGDHVRFADVESYPKPLQDPLPILSGGNSEGARRRAATLADGWIPACLTPEEYRDGLTGIHEIAQAEGRVLRDFEPALQLVVALGDTNEAATNRFRSSQVHTHLTSLGASTMRGRLEDLIVRNLVGDPDQVATRIEAYVEAGVATFAGLLFAADTVVETLDQMEWFSGEVMSRFSDG